MSMNKGKPAEKNDYENVQNEIEDKLVDVNRTVKVVKGGRIFSFTATVVAGDGKERVGMGRGKSREVPVAIKKASEAARRNMRKIELRNGTLQHPVKVRFGATNIWMKPASEGTGIIAGSAMRAVFEVLGVRNVLTKVIGAPNPVNVVQATIKGLTGMMTPEKVASKRGKSIKDILQD